MLTWKSGSVYEGSFVQFKFSGRGRLTTNQNTIEGEFKNGELVNSKETRFANGDKYVGQVSDRHLHGQGIYEYSCGSRFAGNFISGVKDDSSAKLLLATEIGEMAYIGEVKDELMTGKATLTSKTTAIEGVFEDNYLQGHAKITLLRKGILTGEFNENMKHGEFEFKREDSGRKSTSYFQYDVEDSSKTNLSVRF